MEENDQIRLVKHTLAKAQLSPTLLSYESTCRARTKVRPEDMEPGLLLLAVFLLPDMTRAGLSLASRTSLLTKRSETEPFSPRSTGSERLAHSVKRHSFWQRPFPTQCRRVYSRSLGSLKRTVTLILPWPT